MPSSPEGEKETLTLILIILPFFAFSQTTYLPQGDKQTTIWERMETKAGKDTVLNFSKTRPYSRKQLMNGLANYEQQYGSSLSKSDAYNLRSVYLNNMEYVPAENAEQYNSRKAILKSFYKTPANLLKCI